MEQGSAIASCSDPYQDHMELGGHLPHVEPRHKVCGVILSAEQQLCSKMNRDETFASPSRARGLQL